MGNQAQVREGATVVSTSTRNFPNRLGLACKKVTCLAYGSGPGQPTVPPKSLGRTELIKQCDGKLP